MRTNILVIKLGALGDFVQAIGAFDAIRRHHGKARITLLTTHLYAAFAESLGLFDRVWVDSRPRSFQIGKWLALRSRLRNGGFKRVYDLQTSDRSSFYYQLFLPGPRPEWSGIARGCSHPHANPKRNQMYTIKRQAQQLRMAGIDKVFPPNLHKISANVDHFALPGRFALLAPGGAPHRPGKRWSAERYGDLAQHMVENGVTPLLLGTEIESSIMDQITKACPKAVNLANRTSFAAIVSLARRAELAVGNDSGPMHLIAAAGCRCIVLFSGESDPALCWPQSAVGVSILRRNDLRELATADVLASMGLQSSKDALTVDSIALNCLSQPAAFGQGPV